LTKDPVACGGGPLRFSGRSWRTMGQVPWVRRQVHKSLYQGTSKANMSFSSITWVRGPQSMWLWLRGSQSHTKVLMDLLSIAWHPVVCKVCIASRFPPSQSTVGGLPIRTNGLSIAMGLSQISPSARHLLGCNLSRCWSPSISGPRFATWSKKLAPRFRPRI